MSERSDPLADQLRALAPIVDVPAGRDLFERVRSQPDRSTRRWLMPAAVTALLIAGLVGMWALAGDDGSTSNPAAAPDDAEAAFSVLLVAETLSESGTVDVATNADSLEKALEPVADRGGVSVDFDRSIVVVFSVGGNECPQTLDGFEVDGATWTARFAVDERPCADVGLMWAYVVAVDRSALGDSVEFALPDGALDGFAGGLDEPGPEHRDVIAVEESALPFGTIRAVTDEVAYDTMWAADLPDADQPDVDFARRFVVSFTLPDDSCPDTLVQFRSGEQATGRQIERRIIWEPQFEPPPGGCEQPLVTRTYVIAIDRPAVDIDVTFRLPADEVYGYDGTELAITVERMRAVVDLTDVSSGPNSPVEPDLVATDVTLPLPAVGEPALQLGAFGIVWIVHHDDGTVSVLDAVVDRPPNDDNDDDGGGGVEGLGDLVLPTEDGLGFVGQGLVWDSYGRTLNGPRAGDLVGYAGQIVDGEVNLFISNTGTIPGDPIDVPVASPSRRDLDDVPLLDLDVLPTLSYLGPIWRHLDATLVVENGVGTLCEVADDGPVPDLETCDRGVATEVTSTQPEITSWFFGPVLAEFGEFGEIVTVVPLRGSASRNDSPEGASAFPSGDGWRLVTDAGRIDLGALSRFAADEASLSALRASLGLRSLDVDLREEVVVAIPVFGDSCGPAVAGVDIDEGVVDVGFKRSPASSCDEEGIIYGFVIAVDRAAIADSVTVVSTDVSGLPIAGETTYDVSTGSVIDGGLISPTLEPAFAGCGATPDQVDLVLPLESAVAREVRIVLRHGDGTESSERILTVPAGASEARLPLPGGGAADVTAIATSVAPPARTERTIDLSVADIAETTEQCGD